MINESKNDEQVLSDYSFLYNFVFTGYLGDLQSRCKQNIRIADNLVKDEIISKEQSEMLKEKIVDFYKKCLSKELENPSL